MARTIEHTKNPKKTNRVRFEIDQSQEKNFINAQEVEVDDANN